MKSKVYFIPVTESENISAIAKKGASVVKRTFAFLILGICVFFSSGCAVLGVALSAAAAYGLYQATNK